MKIDKASLFGLILGVVAILGGNYLEGGRLSTLFQFTAALIVLGGTIGATLLNYPISVLKTAILSLKKVFSGKQPDLNLKIKTLVIFAQQARREGIGSLQPFADDMADPFLRKGLQMAVDGVDQEMLKNSLELDLDNFEQQEEMHAKVFESAGGYSPTLGILGAVLGLIQVMNNLTDPAKLGAGIAVAFVATIYGVGFANLIYLPIAGKLKNILLKEILEKEVVVEGILAILRGENPRLIEQKLMGFLNGEQRSVYRSVIPKLPSGRYAA